ncbi:hypothetical protein KBC85_03050 [Candidatus Saccharibacteria bacterium]|nr:hypothetical protein [Candidatus Saccharibacteria bacterium]
MFNPGQLATESIPTSGGTKETPPSDDRALQSIGHEIILTTAKDLDRQWEDAARNRSLGIKSEIPNIQSPTKNQLEKLKSVYEEFESLGKYYDWVIEDDGLTIKQDREMALSKKPDIRKAEIYRIRNRLLGYFCKIIEDPNTIKWLKEDRNAPKATFILRIINICCKPLKANATNSDAGSQSSIQESSTINYAELLDQFSEQLKSDDPETTYSKEGFTELKEQYIEFHMFSELFEKATDQNDRSSLKPGHEIAFSDDPKIQYARLAELRDRLIIQANEMLNNPKITDFLSPEQAAFIYRITTICQSALLRIRKEKQLVVGKQYSQIVYGETRTIEYLGIDYSNSKHQFRVTNKDGSVGILNYDWQEETSYGGDFQSGRVTISAQDYRNEFDTRELKTEEIVDITRDLIKSYGEIRNR